MSYPRLRWVPVLLVAAAAVTFIRNERLAFGTNENAGSDCAAGQSCDDDCIMGVQSNPGCKSSGWACISYEGSTTSSTFNACIPGTEPTDWCLYGPIPPPYITCSSGQGYICSCRSLTTGDCDLNSNSTPGCTCSGQSTYTGSFTVNSTCG